MNAYHISFTFDAPSPGTITIAADSTEDAKAKLEDMTKEFTNVKIHEIVDLETVPFLKALFEKQVEESAKEIGEIEPTKMN